MELVATDHYTLDYPALAVIGVVMVITYVVGMIAGTETVLGGLCGVLFLTGLIGGAVFFITESIERENALEADIEKAGYTSVEYTDHKEFEGYTDEGVYVECTLLADNLEETKFEVICK